MVTSRDVAKLANVSVSTVSRAFREDCYISEELKKKVLDAADKLGYTPNLVARSLKNNRSGVIGLVLSDMDNVFYSIVSRVIESDLKKLGYRLIITYNNENQEEELANLNLLAASRADGIIFTPKSAKNHSLIKRLKKQNISLVQMFRVGYPDIDSVLVDDEQGAYMATKHLVKNGHTDILLLSVDYKIHLTFDSKTNEFCDPRSKGYKRALLEEKILIRESNIMHLPYHTDLKSMIIHKIKESKPTAIIAGTNIIAKDVIRACKEMKLTIPNDISLVMFDDVDWASLLDVTTISQPINEIGHIASRTILTQIENQNAKSTPVHSTLEPVLISRYSVKNLYAN